MFASRFTIGLLLSCVGAVLITLCTGDMVDPATNTVIMRGNDTSVRVQGKSGKISTVFFDQDDDDDDNDDDDDEQEDFGDDNEDVLSFEVESLQERNSAGAPVGVSGPGSQLKHAVETLASQVFNFSPLDNTSTFQGIPVKNVNLTTTLNGPQAKLELMVLVFLRDGTVTFGNETFKVQSGTMKFNIKVSEWQFCGDVAVSCVSQNNQQEVGQFLDLSLRITSQAEEPEEVDDAERAQSDKAPICEDPDDPSELDDDCPFIFNMGGNSEMVLNRGVLTDGGSYVPMPTGFPKFELTGMRNKRLIFRIPKFNNTVIIDPSVNVGAPDKGQAGGAGHNNAASSLQFFSFALFLSIFVAQY